MSTILTAAGESLIARLQAEGKALIIDTMILANVPGQDHTQPIAPGVSVPAEAQIALRYAIPPQYRAYVNPNQVVYSAMLGSDMGDFVFNWQGLWCSEHNTLVAVATFPALEKRRYDEANGKTGNNLTRNFLLTFTGARELTGLTISADVWQLDFTVRLNGIDERERLSNFDVYGQAFFDAQGWLLQKTAEAYAFAPGLGYVGGIRAALAESLPLAAPEAATLPQNVWLDVCLKHTGSDRVAEALPMLTPTTAPLTDSAADETGLMHYRALVARIEADGTVSDLRPRKTSGTLPIPDVATSDIAGTMRPDGETCYMQGELLKVFLADQGQAGLMSPDGKTIQVRPDGITAALFPTQKKIITTSGNFSLATVLPWAKEVWARVTLIGGGGGGGKGGSTWLARGGSGGTGGGSTMAFGYTAIGGGGGGGGGTWNVQGAGCGGGGGAAGGVVIEYVKLQVESLYPIVIGAGGAGGSTYSAAYAGEAGTGDGAGKSSVGGMPGFGARGAGHGVGGGNYSGSGEPGHGGNGATLIYPYGGGGGGGAGQEGARDAGAAWGGIGGRGAEDGDYTTPTYPDVNNSGNGGKGGNGAVIIEIYGE